jgi:hypothetical protein
LKSENNDRSPNGKSRQALTTTEHSANASVIVEATAYTINAFKRQNIEECATLSGLSEQERLAALHRWLGFGFPTIWRRGPNACLLNSEV